jgi:glycosyltransferase involved in cell wall biosynthesis
MLEGYVEQSARKKILLLCDDIRYTSGIGTMAREFVIGTAHKFNWVVLGALNNHPDKGKRLDLSLEANKLQGIPDSYIHLIPNEGYGTAKTLRQLMQLDKPDAILIFTDPRYWQWLFDIEREVRSKIPLMYLNIWDNLPAPMYNKSAYESCDSLMAISKQTENINRMVLGKIADEKVITYVPHGIDSNKFYPIDRDHSENKALLDFRAKLNIPLTNFVVFWNSRNIGRKRPGDVIRSFKLFVDSLPKEHQRRCTLVMHTDPIDSNGTDLFKVREVICGDEYDIKFSTQKLRTPEMNYLYNIADVNMLISSNEGWGLSLTESMMAGTMIVANVTGGMQDQMRFEDSNGKWINFTEDFPSNHRRTVENCGQWAVPVFPADISLIGSIPTPYIYDDRCNVEDVAAALKQVWSMPQELRDSAGLAGRDWVMSDESGMSAKRMSENMIDSIEACLDNFKPRQRFELHKLTL